MTDPFSISVPGDLLEEGMLVERPAWVQDYETRQRYDPRRDAPSLPDVLRVDLWATEDGESLLSAPDGSVAIDYNTADYPEMFVLVGPHTSDAVFDDALDVGHDLKIQDPDDCKMIAWDPWWRGSPLSPDQEARARWVLLTICRPGFEDQKTWSYDVALMQGDFDEIESVSTEDWAKAKRAVLDFRRRARAKDPLEVINRHRAKLGMAPLDTTDWTADDIQQEADRIARLANLGRLMP